MHMRTYALYNASHNSYVKCHCVIVLIFLAAPFFFARENSGTLAGDQAGQRHAVGCGAGELCEPVRQKGSSGLVRP